VARLSGMRRGDREVGGGVRSDRDANSRRSYPESDSIQTVFAYPLDSSTSKNFPPIQSIGVDRQNESA
jgi:hypothetical protein